MVSEQTGRAATGQAALRIAARTLSYLFHPLFIPTYIFLWMAERFPYEFAGITADTLFFRIVGVFWTTAFFPAFAVFLLWRLKFTASIYLRTQKERIIPYVISMFFYWWMFYLSRNFTDQPEALKFFYLGIFLSTIFGLIFNNFFKISMHGIAVGGGLACMVLTCFAYSAHLGLDLSVACIVTGLVCSARLLLSDHNSREIYSGLAVGLLSQLAAYIYVMD